MKLEVGVVGVERTSAQDRALDPKHKYFQKTYLRHYHMFSIVLHHLPFQNHLQLIQRQEGQSTAQQPVAHVTEWKQKMPSGRGTAVEPYTKARERRSGWAGYRDHAGRQKAKNHGSSV